MQVIKVSNEESPPARQGGKTSPHEHNNLATIRREKLKESHH